MGISATAVGSSHETPRPTALLTGQARAATVLVGRPAFMMP